MSASPSASCSAAYGSCVDFSSDVCAVAVQLSPVPAVKLQKSFQLGNTPVCLRVQYEVPLDGIDEPLKAPARFFLRWGTVRCKPVRDLTIGASSTAAFSLRR